MFELIIHAKAKVGVSLHCTSFAVILSAVALPIVLKAEFIFKLILYIYLPFLFSLQLKEGKIIHLFRFSLNSSSSPASEISVFFFCTFLFMGLRSGEDTDVGRQRFDLSSPHTPISWL